jgi:hypothetical protein
VNICVAERFDENALIEKKRR